MNWKPIHKHFHAGSLRSNLDDYGRVCAEFKWAAVRAELNGAGNANIAVTIDRHAEGALRDHIALRWLSKAGTRRDISYAELAAETSRFASVSRGVGVGKNNRVAASLCRCVFSAAPSRIGSLSARSPRKLRR
jgi:acetyl-CoA synthetase